jgi:hypothetical protein
MKKGFRKTGKARVSSNSSFLLLKLWGCPTTESASLIMRGALVWIFGRHPVLCWYKPFSATTDSWCSCVVSEMYSDVVGGDVSVPHPLLLLRKVYVGPLPFSAPFAMNIATSALGVSLEWLEDTTWQGTYLSQATKPQAHLYVCIY